MARLLALLFLVSMQSCWQSADAFVIVPRTPSTQHQNSCQFRNHQPLQLVSPDDCSSAITSSFSTLVMAGDSSWRQYVSLAVIAGVLIDIVLGSPLANMLLKPMRGDQEEEGDDTGEGKKASGAKNDITRSKERIDSEQVAKAAIDRAQNALELRRFLDERKTDWDRMEDMKRKLDAEMQDLDEDLQAREESLAKRRNGGK